MKSNISSKISLERGGKSALRVAAAYVLVSAIWIVSSDYLLLAIFRDPTLITSYQTIKGWIFILISGGLIYILARREYRGWLHSADALANLNRALRVLNACNRALVRFDEEKELLGAICKVIVEEGGYRMAWVGYMDESGGDRVKPVAWQGFEDGYLEKKHIRSDETDSDQGPFGEALGKRQTVVIRNILSDARFAPWLEEALLRSYSSAILLPLETENSVLGILSIYHSQPDVFDADEVGLLEELAQDLAYGIAAIRSHKLRQEAEERLSESRQRFHSLVENAPLGIAISSKGKLSYANPAFMRMFSHQDGSQLIGHPVVELVAPEQRSEVSRRIDLREQGGEVPISHEFTGLRQDGSRFTLRSQICYLQWENSPASLGFFTDISEHVQVEDSLRQQNRRLSALRKIDKAISTSMDLKVTLNVLLDQVLIELEADAASIRRLNSLTHELEPLALQGFRLQNPAPIYLFDEQCAPVCAVLERRPQHFSGGDETAAGNFAQILDQEGFDDYYATPLLAKGNVLGVLEVYHRSSQEHGRDWHDFLELLAGEAGIAIENARLFDDLQRSNIELMRDYDTTIEIIVRAMEMREPGVFGHTHRIVEMTLRLARQFSLNDEQLVSIRRGAYLHDIGMLSIPDAVLFKATGLDDSEWDLIQQHPQAAVDLLTAGHFLRDATDIPLCHHERWDGSGYPRRLKGDQIPLSARIFAIIDVWDSLQSARPYRKAWQEEETMEYLRQQAGAQFDPQIVESFLQMLNEI